jgi:hypothetical protein
MKRLFEGVPQVFGRFYDGVVPRDELAHRLWADYEKIYRLDTTNKRSNQNE